MIALLTSVLAHASPALPPATLPGRRLALPRCTPAPADDCWEAAPELRRFAPGPGLPTAPVAGRVRLAWDPEGLLIRIDELPQDGAPQGILDPTQGDGAQLEAALGGTKATGRLARTVATRTRAHGIHRLPVGLALGEERELWLNLVVNSADGGRAALPWTPAGEGDPVRPGSVVLVERPDLDLAVSFARDATTWQVEAWGASEITLQHERAVVPWGSRGLPEPWTRTGADTLAVPSSPETGWHTLSLTWRDAAGQPVDALALRFWHEAPAPEPPLIWPPPRQLDRGQDVALALGPSVGICGPEGPAALLAEELTRFTGVRATTAAPGAAGCELRLALDPALGPEAFAIAVAEGEATVRGGDLAGLSYGALALADAIGPDGQSPTLAVSDAPDIAERPLFHSVQVGNRPDLTVDTYIRWLRRVVLRGRYDALHLMLSDGLAWETDPALAHPRAWSKDELARLDRALDAVGIELVPGVNAPGHSEWILRHHPALMEDVNRSLLDTRHPETRPLLSALWDEAWQSFGRPAAIHIGHDEAIWQSARWFGDERNPRSAASPKWFLLADDIRWHLNWCRQRGLQAYLWSDLLLAGWNGAKDGGHHALDELSPAELAEPIVMAWSPLGDPLVHLAQDRGMQVMRVHTGYLEWKRAGLDTLADQLAGEGLGLFQPAPWAAFGPAAGSRPLHYHLGATLLAGATAWRTDLVQTHIEPSLGALVGHPASRPGLEAGIFAPEGRPLRITGAAPDARLPGVDWPARVVSDGQRIPLQPAVARAGAPVTVVPRRGTGDGLSLLHATELSHAAAAAMRADLRRGPAHHPTWWLVVEWADGEQARLPMVYGLDTYSLAGDHRGDLQWTVADTVPLASPAAAATAPAGSALPPPRDRRLYRTDWRNPRPGVPVAAWRVEVDRPGVAVIVGGGLVRSERP